MDGLRTYYGNIVACRPFEKLWTWAPHASQAFTRTEKRTRLGLTDKGSNLPPAPGLCHFGVAIFVIPLAAVTGNPIGIKLEQANLVVGACKL